MGLESILAEKLRQIFQVDRVTFDAPSESAEQNTLFVQVEKAHSNITAKTHIARVNGRITMFSTAEALPYGFFAKQIEDAKDKADFFFYDFDQSTQHSVNLVERSVSFVFFFKGQYDPEVGIINDINVEVSS